MGCQIVAGFGISYFPNDLRFGFIGRMRAIPQGQKWTFNDFLRLAIGKNIASARTKKTRLKFLNQFLLWWLNACRNPNETFFGHELWSRTDETMRHGNWTPEQIISSKKRDGFAQNEQDFWQFAIGVDGGVNVVEKRRFENPGTVK